MRDASDYRYSLDLVDERAEELETEIERLRATLTLVRDLLKGQKGAVAASLRSICDDGLRSLKATTPEA